MNRRPAYMAICGLAIAWSTIRAETGSLTLLLTVAIASSTWR